MRKLSTILMAMALVLGMAQCKKEQPQPEDPAQGEKVFITLDVNGNNGGSRVDVNTATGTVNFEAGDVVYVGNNGAYCGYLEHNGTRFEGYITPTSGNDADYLHFYFMGNKGPKSEPTSVYIADQTAKYPVISYARSTDLYNSGTISYKARLLNYCAIMRFDVTGANANDVVTITGMNNIVEVDFSKNNASGDPVNPYTYSKIGSGDIRLHNEANGERWAILLPQDEVTTATASAGGYTHSPAFTVPAVSANGYYGTPVNVAIQSYTPREFSVDANDKKVRFAPANLQYTKSTGEWSFMGRQWSMVETRGQDVGDNYANQDVVGLFGWGTWGEGKNPSNTSKNWRTDYTWSTDFQGTLDGYSTWHTLTIQEWCYLFSYDGDGDANYNFANTTRVGKNAFATVNGIYGVVLLPDTWTLPPGCSFTPGGRTTGWDTNIYDAVDWALMEANGAVFLPAAGNRTGTIENSTTVQGNYWTNSTNSQYVGWGWSMEQAYTYPDMDIIYRAAINNSARHLGYSVRLVRVVE